MEIRTNQVYNLLVFLFYILNQVLNYFLLRLLLYKYQIKLLDTAVTNDGLI